MYIYIYIYIYIYTYIHMCVYLCVFMCVYNFSDAIKNKHRSSSNLCFLASDWSNNFCAFAGNSFIGFSSNSLWNSTGRINLVSLMNSHQFIACGFWSRIRAFADKLLIRLISHLVDELILGLPRHDGSHQEL